MVEQSVNYDQVLTELLVWYQSKRESGTKIQLTDSTLDKAYSASTKETILSMYPPVNRAMLDIRAANQLVVSDTDASLESFYDSPLTRLYTGLQVLRKELLLQMLERAEIFEAVPDNIASQLNPAWHKLHSEQIVPLRNLGSQTTWNVAHFAQATDRLAWEGFAEGLRTTNTLLKRTLAAKFHFNTTVGLGYNKAASQLCSGMLSSLDMATLCNPWQLEHDRQGYIQRLHQTTNFYLRQPHFRHFLREGGMWSNEMFERPEIQQWMEALESGEYTPLKS